METKLRQIQYTLHKWLFLLLIFSFPIHWRLAPAIILMLFINSLFSGGIKRGVQTWRNHRTIRIALILYTSLFFLYLAGLLYSQDIHTGLQHIERKLALVILPYLLLGLPAHFFDQKNTRGFLLALMLGALTSGIIMISYSLIHSPAEDIFNQVRQYKYKYYHHTYYAIYLCLSVCFLLGDISKRQLPALLRYTLLIVFSVFIYFSFSRSGIVSLSSILLLYGVSVWRRQQRRMIYLLVAIPFMALILIVGIQHPDIKKTCQGIDQIIDHGASPYATSGMQRIRLWETSISCIRGRPMLGYGTGSSGVVLQRNYEKQGLTNFSQQQFNAHNQYLETYLDIGLGGLSLLILLLSYFLFIGFRKNNITLVLLVVVLGFGFMFESMLNRFAGVFPFAFFPLYLLLQKTKEKKTKQS